MILWIHSDASYLSEPKARSTVGGFFYLGNHDHGPNILNGTIHVKVEIFKPVVASATEAEFGALFVNGKEGEPIRTMLQ